LGTGNRWAAAISRAIPYAINRENISRKRDFLGGIREFQLQYIEEQNNRPSPRCQIILRRRHSSARSHSAIAFDLNGPEATNQRGVCRTGSTQRAALGARVPIDLRIIADG
jgi:hypothetical protein